MANQKDKFIQFPLSLLRRIHKDQINTIDSMFNYSIYKIGQKASFTREAVAKQLIYNFYKDNLDNRLKYEYQNYIDQGLINPNFDYSGGFDLDGKFEPEDELFEVLEIFDKDPNMVQIEKLSFDYFRFKHALKVLEMKASFLSYYEGEKIMLEKPEKEPEPVISKKLAFDYLKNKRDENQLMSFCFYVGFCSLLGDKSFVFTNKDMIVARAFGYKTTDELKKSAIPRTKLYKKYSTRYWIDEMFFDVQDIFNILIYSKKGVRGIYAGFAHKISLNELILKSFLIQKKERRNKHNIRVLEAEKEILQQLNKDSNETTLKKQ